MKINHKGNSAKNSLCFYKVWTALVSLLTKSLLETVEVWKPASKHVPIQAILQSQPAKLVSSSLRPNLKLQKCRFKLSLGLLTLYLSKNSGNVLCMGPDQGHTADGEYASLLESVIFQDTRHMGFKTQGHLSNTLDTHCHSLFLSTMVSAAGAQPPVSVHRPSGL